MVIPEKTNSQDCLWVLDKMSSENDHFDRAGRFFAVDLFGSDRGINKKRLPCCKTVSF